MNLYGIICERVDPIAPEAYVCRWGDRNKLALGLLGEGKGTRTCRKGDQAVVTVESYLDAETGQHWQPFSVAAG